nr:hypothetical protein [Tanacetum cinerariifolium]
MSTQQDIYTVGYENRPPMLNKDNYVPWSSRIIRYARSRPNGKMIVDSIKNGPYVRRMIATPGEPDLPVPILESFHEKIDKKLTENDIKRIDADDQAIQTILLGLPEDVYAAVDSCETAKEIWEHVLQMMKGSTLRNRRRRQSSSMNGKTKLKFLNNLQPEWKRHVTIVRQTKNLHEADFTQIYDILKMNPDEVNELRAKRLAKTHDPLTLMAHSQNSYNFPVTHNDQSSSSTHSQQSFPINNKYNPQPSLNQNFMQPPMNSLKDINDPTKAMNATLILFAKAFQLTASTNNNLRTSSNPRNRQITQPGIANQNGTGNIIVARAEGSGNGNQARCYNCKGLGIQLQVEEFDFMAVAGDLDEIEEVNANCILMANLQHASTSSTQFDKASVYDTYGSAKLRAWLFENTSESMNNTSGMSVTPQVDKPKLIAVTPYSKKLHASIPSHSVPQPREFNVMKHSNVIAPGMFKIDPSQTSRVDLVPNNQSSASIRTNPITNYQRHVTVKENVSSYTVNASSTGLVHTARTRRPQPKGNTRNARVSYASKSSEVLKNATVKDHRRSLLLSKNKKTMSSKCNNIKLAIRNDKSKIACGTCKQCLVTANHDAGYGDLKWGNITITRVYFIEGLGHNLFLVGQFCDTDLEVVFRRNTCFIRDLDVVVDNYSRYTWVHFPRAKDEMPEALKEYFDSVGITHETSAAKTPQQNGVVEPCVFMLVEVARTMLIFSHAPLFLWAETIATNDHEDIGKLGVKGDIGFFIGYSANSVAYRMYNWRIKKIMETMNITLDELSAMAFEQNSSKPGLPTPRTIHAAPMLQDLQAPTASMSIQDSAPAPTNSSNTLVSSHNVDAPSQQHGQQQRNLTPSTTASAANDDPNAVFKGDLFVNPFATPSIESVVSYTQYVLVGKVPELQVLLRELSRFEILLGELG